MNGIRTPVEKKLVSETDKIKAIPAFLHPYFIEIEARTCDFLRTYSDEYTGGSWNYYTLSNSGFFMAPCSHKFYTVSIPGNYFDAKVDAEAAGLISFLYAVNMVLAKQADLPDGPDEELLHFYNLVLAYAVSDSPYRVKIACAID